jgi:signal transduction histidine kinase
MSYDIVTQGHGGTLTVESDEGQGAIFVVTLAVSEDFSSATPH